jgi:type I restriction-modification system DNA methylase subunit
MSEELISRGLLLETEKIGKWDFYRIGNTNLKALKQNGIIRSVDYGDFEKKKIDGLIVQKKNVIAIIEYKIPSEFNTVAKQNKAVRQELEVAKKLGSKIIIATDTLETVWVNTLTGQKIKDEDGNEIRINFDPKDEKLPDLIEKINYSINEKNDQLKSKQLVNPTDLARQIWQDIWSVSGESPANCLYSFVELFIFKYLSDLGVLGQGVNFDHLMERFSYDIDHPEEEALEYYAKNIRTKIKKLFPQNLLDNTTIINGTVFINKDQQAVRGYSTVFKKVLNRFKNYGKLENIDYDFKSKLFESFLKEGISKKNLGQFFTPLKVVRAIVKMAEGDIREGIKMCDPACGVGKFLLEPIITRLGDYYDINSKTGITPKITIHGFDKGFDNEEQKTIILAKANMLIYFSDLIRENPGLTEEFSKLFNDSFTLKTNSILGTLSDPTENEYDLILTNPPYVTSGSSNLKEEIKNDAILKKYYKINALGVEGLFLEWIIRALKPNGKAFVVIPDGILNRQNDKNLRKFILDECFIDGIISLPLNTFFTTNKKTYILCVTKKRNKSEVQKDPVFTYLVSEIGESRDVYRFDIDQNDLNEAVALYSFFRGNKNGFAKINNDKRCKIQPIERFDPNQHWSIDRWWPQEEQIELGIVEEKDSIDTNAFSELVGNISQNLAEYSELLKELSEKKKIINRRVEISLSDKRYFELFIGKRLVKKDLIKITGKIPIYSANVYFPISHHTKSNISDFSNNFVIWGIDGDFEFNCIQKHTPFVTTDHCGTIRILNDDILPEYLMLQLEHKKHLYGFDRGLRASLTNMERVFIDLPFDENNNIDIDKQLEVIDKYQYIAELKNKIAAYKRKIDSLNVVLDADVKGKTFKLIDLFDIVRGDGKYTKKYGNTNKGNYPVYSASNKQPLTLIDTYDFDDEYLTWATNGFAGYIRILTGKFSINADRGLLKPKTERVNIHYIKTILEPQLRALAKGRIGEKREDEFTKVYPSMLKDLSLIVPTDSQGEIDLKAQNLIAETHNQIEKIKLSITQELDKIFSKVIELV